MLHVTSQPGEGKANLDIPPMFLCPISKKLMTDPVLFSDDGNTYEREALEDWIKTKKTHPKTGAPIKTTVCFPNNALKEMILKFIQAHPELAESDLLYVPKQQRLDNELMQAARAGHVKEIKQALAKGANPLTEDTAGNSILHLLLASKSFKAETFKACLPTGVKAKQNEDEKSDEAAPETEVFDFPLQTLLKKTNGAGKTPLHVCVKHQAGMITSLIEQGAVVDKQDHAGNTPLHDAMASGKQEAIESLILHGADMDITNKKNLTPFDLVLEKPGLQLILLKATKKYNETIRQRNSQYKKIENEHEKMKKSKSLLETSIASTNKVNELLNTQIQSEQKKWQQEKEKYKQLEQSKSLLEFSVDWVTDQWEKQTLRLKNIAKPLLKKQAAEKPYWKLLQSGVLQSDSETDSKENDEPENNKSQKPFNRLSIAKKEDTPPLSDKILPWKKQKESVRQTLDHLDQIAQFSLFQQTLSKKIDNKLSQVIKTKDFSVLTPLMKYDAIKADIQANICQEDWIHQYLSLPDDRKVVIQKRQVTVTGLKEAIEALKNLSENLTRISNQLEILNRDNQYNQWSGQSRANGTRWSVRLKNFRELVNLIVKVEQSLKGVIQVTTLERARSELAKNKDMIKNILDMSRLLEARLKVYEMYEKCILDKTGQVMQWRWPKSVSYTEKGYSIVWLEKCPKVRRISGNIVSEFWVRNNPQSMLTHSRTVRQKASSLYTTLRMYEVLSSQPVTRLAKRQDNYNQFVLQFKPPAKPAPKDTTPSLSK